MTMKSYENNITDHGADGTETNGCIAGAALW